MGKRMTLEELAAEFGVNKTTVLRWEEGRIPAERVVEVEAITGIPRHDLRPDLWGKRSISRSREMA